MASVFKFFELPPELRNFVYRNLTSEEATAVALPAWNKWDEAWEASIELYVDTALLTVSKQFKQEYENEVCPDSVLRVTCTAHEVIATTIRPVKLPGMYEIFLPMLLERGNMPSQRCASDIQLNLGLDRQHTRKHYPHGA